MRTWHKAQRGLTLKTVAGAGVLTPHGLVAAQFIAHFTATQALQVCAINRAATGLS